MLKIIRWFLTAFMMTNHFQGLNMDIRPSQRGPGPRFIDHGTGLPPLLCAADIPTSTVPCICHATTCLWAFEPTVSSSRSVLLSPSLPHLVRSSQASHLSPIVCFLGKLLLTLLTRFFIPIGSQSTAWLLSVALNTDDHIYMYLCDDNLTGCLPPAYITHSRGTLTYSSPYYVLRVSHSCCYTLSE